MVSTRWDICYWFSSTTIPVVVAVWRGYYEAAYEVLKFYGTGLYGKGKIADKMNHNGWFFRNRYGQPQPFTQDDVRRIVRNWVEYGGVVLGQRAKDRRLNEVNAEMVTLNPERAVFEVELLYQAARVLNTRTIEMTHPDYGAHTDAYVYPLSKIIYCAHCDSLIHWQRHRVIQASASPFQVRELLTNAVTAINTLRNGVVALIAPCPLKSLMTALPV